MPLKSVPFERNTKVSFLAKCFLGISASSDSLPRNKGSSQFLTPMFLGGEEVAITHTIHVWIQWIITCQSTHFLVSRSARPSSSRPAFHHHVEKIHRFYGRIRGNSWVFPKNNFVPPNHPLFLGPFWGVSLFVGNTHIGGKGSSKIRKFPINAKTSEKTPEPQLQPIMEANPATTMDTLNICNPL